MNGLEAVRTVMTPEQRKQHDVLCAARVAGVMTDEEYAQIEEIVRSGKLDAYIAELKVRMRQVGAVGGDGHEVQPQ